MIGKILFSAISGIISLLLALKLSESGLIHGIEYNGPIKTILITGIFLGLIYFLIKPILKSISLPLRIITLGISSLILNMFIIWVIVDIFSPIEIHGLLPLFWTTVIFWITNFFLGVNRS